jgi:fructose-1-phosphate kinase PfkB-like protein
MSGSSPCQVTDDVFALLVRLARTMRVRTLVDTYGACLTQALAAVPDVAKMNRQECEQALHRDLDSAAAIRAALLQLRERGIGLAAVTFGPRGMAAAWGDQVAAWKPPTVRLINPIGAGDAMTAGLVEALLRGEEPSRAVPWAMACAVASVEHWVACEFQREEAEAMMPQLTECALEDLVG